LNFGLRFSKGIGNLVIDDDPFGRHADLALIHECAERGGVDRLIEVGVVKDHQRSLAAEFQQDGLQVFGGSLAIMRPTLVEPVKLMRQVAGCAISASTIFGAPAGAFLIPCPCINSAS